MNTEQVVIEADVTGPKLKEERCLMPVKPLYEVWVFLGWCRVVDFLKQILPFRVFPSASPSVLEHGQMGLTKG